MLLTSLFNLTKNDFQILSNKWTQSLPKALENCGTSVAPKSTQCYVIGTFSDVFELTNSDFRHLTMPLLPRLFGFFIKDSGKLYFSELSHQHAIKYVLCTFTRTDCQ